MLISHRPEMTCSREADPHADARVELADKQRGEKPDRRAGPRAASTSPMSVSGYPACCCNSGGNSTIGVKFSMPKTPTSTRPSA